MRYSIDGKAILFTNFDLREYDNAYALSTRFLPFDSKKAKISVFVVPQFDKKEDNYKEKSYKKEHNY